MIDYKNTLNLPDMKKFPMRADLLLKEPVILKLWYEDNLYEMIRHKKKEKKLFLLHDGPIYANGSIHLGHAVNKILKDIVLKFKSLMGYNAPYIPGWDCHGLPIELQVEKLMNVVSSSMNAKEFRNVCRSYVLKQIEDQKKDFIRFGIIGDWNNPYLTMDFKTEANIIRTLSKVISNNYLYKGTKPVHWCFQCCSVLAESEVEYNNDHCSCAIDVVFKAVDSVNIIKIFNVHWCCNMVIELVVWTTTPWTLPVNQAIAVHPHHIYQLIKMKSIDNNIRYMIIASNVVKVVMNRISCLSWKVLGETIGSSLEFIRFRHPFMSFDIPIVLSSHVSCHSGTGIVHIAPNHGMDDYIIAKKYNFKVVDLVNDKGCYTLNNCSMLDGLHVLQSNEVIVNLLRQSEALLHIDLAYRHSYPYCWRHATPVIFRATSQWFLSMDKCDLRNRLLNAIYKVDWIPKNSQYNIKTLIVDRPDWCLSRQRMWGVPMPLFFHKKTENLHPRTCELIEIVAQRIEKYGVQVWWDLKTEDLIGDESVQYEKVLDTLDVWFDAGSTHDSVILERSECLKELPDLYIEGADQHRGWFMSSLVISTVIRDTAPYKIVLSHGFTVDANGRKMSKSIGNIISPQEIINNFGADILRLWVASSDYSKDIIISDNILKSVTDIYRRIRNTIRFCLVNLSDFNPAQHSVTSDIMIALDRWAIHRALSVQSDVISDYNNYSFHNVIQRIMRFCSVDMGSFYLDIIKDRQYTTKKDSIARRSCQTALYHIIEAMVRWIAPILSFTADEIWKCIPGYRSKYVFTEEWYDGLFSICAQDMMNDSFWNVFFKVRNAVNKMIEEWRISGVIGGSLEVSIILYANAEFTKYLRIIQDELHFGLLTSSAVIVDYYHIDNVIDKQEVMPGLKIILEKAEGKKCLRCWHYRTDVGQYAGYLNICERCFNNIIGPGEIRRFF